MPHLTVRRITLAVLAAAALALPAAGAPAQPDAAAGAPVVGKQGPVEFKDPTNAALLYYKIWMEPEYRDLQSLCGEELKGDPLWKPGAELVKKLDEQKSIVDRLIRATRAPTADFGIEYAHGINAVLPHLGMMRGSARILACDARRCLAAGDVDGACERIAAMYRLARHGANDRVLISGLVSIAITALANSQTQLVIDSNRLTADGKRLLMTELTALSSPDGWSVKRSLDGERWWTVGWLRSVATGPEAGKNILEQLRPLVGEELDPRTAKQIADMNEGAVNAALDKASGYYDAALEAWDAADAAQRLGTLESRLAGGEFGVFAKLLGPALSKCYQSEAKARAELAAIRNKVEFYIPIGR